jgi:hypothetical protein
MGKLGVTGRDTPKMKDLRRDEEIRIKIYELFRLFFFGEEHTMMERVIETNYLEKKLDKYEKFMVNKVIIGFKEIEKTRPMHLD